MDLLLPILTGMQFSELEFALGNWVQRIVGTDIFLMGLLLVIIMLFFFIKMGVGTEATIILSAFLLFVLTAGMNGGGNLKNAGMLPDMVLYGFLIVAGFVIWLAFFKRDINS